MYIERIHDEGGYGPNVQNISRHKKICVQIPCKTSCHCGFIHLDNYFEKDYGTCNCREADVSPPPAESLLYFERE